MGGREMRKGVERDVEDMHNNDKNNAK